MRRILITVLALTAVAGPAAAETGGGCHGESEDQDTAHGGFIRDA